MSIELIVLAAIAVFVISRLYAVLGSKTGHEPTPRRLKEAPVRTPEREEETQAEEERPRMRPAFTGPAAGGMEAIAAIDTQFNPDDFTKGARRAYELIVTAYADGDRDALRQLVDDDVMEVYNAAITEREKAGTEPLRLVRLRQAKIAEASLEDATKLARIAVSFESELSDGETMRPAKEVWTFKRLLKSQDPNWVLDEVATAS